MKTIKIKSTGVVTTVSEEYFTEYERGGWFIEVLPEPEVLEVKPKVKTKG